MKNHLQYMTDTKNKVEELDRLHAAMKEKLVTTSTTEKLQILTLVPNSWLQKYCSEYFGVSEYLIRSAIELKQRKGILAQPSQKKGKAMAQETIDLVHAFYEGDEYSRQLPGEKRLWKHTGRCSQTEVVSSVQSP